MRQRRPSFETLMAELELIEHPEGGYFKLNYQAEERVRKISGSYEGEERAASSHIYYLLSGKQYSAWHKVNSDEIWHFCTGSPIKIYIFDKETRDINTVILGNPLDHPESVFHYCVKRDRWFAAQPIDESRYSLVTCTVTPGFDYKDWQLAKREELIAQYPEHEALIEKFLKKETAEDVENSTMTI